MLIYNIDEIDIENDITFKQRIDVGKVLIDDKLSELEKFKATMKILHDKNVTLLDLTFDVRKKYLKYFEKIVKGIMYWMNAERIMLHHNPDIDEIQAGIEEYSKNVQELGTIKALAKTFSQDPDTILEWKYSKVFGFLYADLEEAKFAKRYQKVIERKNKTK